MRIIPARAGFTTPSAGSPAASPDHPRSRGVYHIINRRVKHYAGSSPLARGLRDTIEEVHVDLGIIPARAGFTVGFKVVKCKP